MSTETARQKIWALPVGIVLTVAIFTATFYSYAEGVRLHQSKGLVPIAVGVAVFAALMVFLTATTLKKEGNRRLGLAIAIVLAESAVFAYGLMFLILNIYGS
jgi:hypothetical protein